MKALRDETRNLVRIELSMQADGDQTAETQGFLMGWLACAMSAGTITLAEKEAAALAVRGSRVPAHLPRWWIVDPCYVG